MSNPHFKSYIYISNNYINKIILKINYFQIDKIKYFINL